MCVTLQKICDLSNANEKQNDVLMVNPPEKKAFVSNSFKNVFEVKSVGSQHKWSIDVIHSIADGSCQAVFKFESVFLYGRCVFSLDVWLETLAIIPQNWLCVLLCMGDSRVVRVNIIAWMYMYVLYEYIIKSYFIFF